MRKPKQHQIDAAEAAARELGESSRTTIVLPCGTGKTMIAGMVAGIMKPKTVILFFPSIALIKQTLTTWRKEKPIGEFDCLCVCSDETVSDNDPDVTVSDLVSSGIPVTTDQSAIRSFMEGKGALPRVLFSTYQSARSIRLSRPADFAVMDEAHRTAGAAGLFSFCLEDENIPIHKRLFMTATPRHAQADSGDAKSFSMLDEDVYGRISYLMSISEAISKGLICDYRIVVSVVVDKDIERLNADGAVKKNRLGMLVNASAIQSAVDRFSVKKIIAFHNNVATARNFAADPVIRNVITGVDRIYHVNGKMSSSERDGVMKSFSRDGRSLVTNARCLTEGVDIPAVDMVVIAARRTSVTDIVQSSGRALRRHGDKKIGYIMIPLHVNVMHGEGLENAIRRSGFSDVWRVVNSMREQDMILAGVGKNKRCISRQDTKKSVVDHVTVIGSLGIEVTDSIRKSMDALLLSRLDARSWEESFDMLVEQHKRHGTWKFGKVDPDLGFLDNWLETQRKAAQSGRLSEKKRAALQDIGWSFDKSPNRWEASFDRFVNEMKETGKHPKGRWVDHQRLSWRQGKLSEERIKRLEAAGFVFKPHAGRKPGPGLGANLNGSPSSVSERAMPPSMDAPRNPAEDLAFLIRLRLSSIRDELMISSSLPGERRYESLVSNAVAMHGLQYIIDLEEKKGLDAFPEMKAWWVEDLKPHVKQLFAYRSKNAQ